MKTNNSKGTKVKIYLALLITLLLITGCSNKKENIDLSKVTSFQLIELTDTDTDYTDKNNLLDLVKNGYESIQVLEYNNNDEVEMLKLFTESFKLSESDAVFPVGGKRTFELKLQAQSDNERYFITYTGEDVTTLFYQINTNTNEVKLFYTSTDVLEKTLNKLIPN